MTWRENQDWASAVTGDLGVHRNAWNTEDFRVMADSVGESPSRGYHDVASLGFQALEAVCTDLSANRPYSDELGWLDYEAMSALAEFDSIVGYVIPDPRAHIDEHSDFNFHVQALRGALPWSEGERNWLSEMILEPPVRINWRTTPDRELTILDAVAGKTGDAMSEGRFKTVTGSELLERFRQWRREEGDYAGGMGLDRARTALAGIITLLRPSIGLPAEYEETRPLSTYAARD